MDTISVSFLAHSILIFCRISAALYLLPGFGERYIIRRFRIVIAIMISCLFVSFIKIPNEIDNVLLIELMIREALIGSIFGIIIKILFNTIHTVGFTAAMQSGLGASTFFDSSQKEQVSIFGSFFNITSITAIFVTNTHHIFIQGVFDSYNLIPIELDYNILKHGSLMPTIVNEAFIVAFKLLAPFLVVNTTISVGSGILARLMPNLQVFFVLSPIQIIASFAILALTIDIITTDLIALIIKYVNMFVSNKIY